MSPVSRELVDYRVVASISDSRRRHSPPPVAAIAAMAAVRHGVLSLDELTNAGLGPRAAQRLAAAGWLHRLYPGVYAVGHPGVSVEGRRRAAVLACGPRAALSYGSAAAAWGIGSDDAHRWHVTVPHGRQSVPPDVCPHQSRHLAAEDVALLGAVRVTTVARTLVDQAAVLSRDELEREVHEAFVRRLVGGLEILAVADRLRGRRGLGVLRALVLEATQGVTRSELERRFADLCGRFGIVAPRRNVRLNGFEVDALWADARVVVELDGLQFHGTRRAFERDRRRDAALLAAGYVVLRLTWRRITEEPAHVAKEVQALLALRGGGE